MSAFAVLVERYRFPAPALLAVLLQQHANMPQPVAVKLRGAREGLLWKTPHQNKPKHSAAALTAASHPASVIPQDRVPPASTPRRVHVLALGGEALGVHLKYSGAPEWIEWRDVLVISAGAIKSEAVKTITSESRDMHGMLHLDQRTQVDLQTNLVAEVLADVAHGTRLVHFRLACHEVNYAKTLGSTIHESWREKFSLLLAKLGLRAERRLVSPQTESLLAAGMVPSDAALDPYFLSDDDFASYNRWLLCRKRLGRTV